MRSFSVGLHRGDAVPRAASVLVGFGGAMMMTTAAGLIRPLLVIAAAIALVGFGWVALATSYAQAAVTGDVPGRRASIPSGPET